MPDDHSHYIGERVPGHPQCISRHELEENMRKTGFGSNWGCCQN
jgi:hypothetical protein